MPEQIYLTDGVMDFSLGVDSGKLPLVQSDSNPNGVRRDQIPWGANLTCRGGGLTQRAGWKYLTTISDGQSLYQGGYMYDPPSADPYLVLSIGGHLIQVECLAGFAPVDLSAAFGLFNPATVDQAYFTQGEEFLINQAGDYVTKPLIWNATANVLQRSFGITGNPLTSQLPAAGPMDYYMQRIWYGQFVNGGWTTSAGDICGGAHGSGAYHQRDAILHVTENPLAAAGDGFSLPSASGPIRAIAHSAAIDKAFGEGQLFVFTRKNISHLAVPITRADWTSTTEPLQTVVQRKYGTPAERSVVAVNGDLFYQTMEPGIRTLALAVRYFNQWGNTPISRNLNRVVPFQDRALLRFGSGMLFDNRLYQTILPFQSGPAGVAHSAFAVLDFDNLGSLQDKMQGDAIPAWDGIQTGLNVLQGFVGDFGGKDRAFAVVVSSVDGTIQLWELTSGDQFENGDNRVTWTFELPALDWGNAFQFKELQGGRLWIDRISGKIDVLVEYRSDDSPCWTEWAQFIRCYARTSCEDLANPICYPIQTYGEGYEKPLSLPKPNMKVCAPNGNRPMAQGYTFQVRITLKGFGRFRGCLLYATERQLSLHSNQTC